MPAWRTGGRVLSDLGDPWLTESHWDEHYWDSETHQITERLQSGMGLLHGLVANIQDPH